MCRRHVLVIRELELLRGVLPSPLGLRFFFLLNGHKPNPVEQIESVDVERDPRSARILDEVFFLNAAVG